MDNLDINTWACLFFKHLLGENPLFFIRSAMMKLQYDLEDLTQYLDVNELYTTLS